uniref:Translation initiation factor eIF2B subunit beta n=1 Tax=Caenorhabditis tropicalis TaxID=1561998 RepID=A0A1I7TU34_9PELO
MDPTTEIEELKRMFIFSLRKKYPRDSSSAIATATVHLLRKILNRENPKTMNDLQVSLANHCKRLHAAERSELIIINMGLMISKLARDEVLQKKGGGEPEPLYTLWRDDDETTEKLKTADMKKIKKDLQASIKELTSEIDSSRDCIAIQSTELLFNNDVVMVHSLASSKTMHAFLTHATKSGRKHRVIDIVDEEEQLESAPDFVSPIELYEVASRMPETSKVVLVAAAYFPDGSCLVPAGGHQIALLAKRHCVPVYVLAPFYKLCPFFMTDPDSLHTFRSNQLPFDLSAKSVGLVDCLHPAFDCLQSDLVTLFVSNTSCIIPSHVNRLKEDYYHAQDIADY